MLISTLIGMMAGIALDSWTVASKNKDPPAATHNQVVAGPSIFSVQLPPIDLQGKIIYHEIKTLEDDEL